MQPVTVRDRLSLLRIVLAAFVAACTVTPEPDETPPADPIETAAFFDDDDGGNASADDPAIWIHPTDPDASLVIVTKKDAGLSVFDMTGAQIQAIAPPPAPGPMDNPGRFNNVDLLYAVQIGSATSDVAVTSDRGHDRVRFYAIDPRGAAAGADALRDITAASVAPIFSANQEEINSKKTAYGLAAWTDPSSGVPYVIVSQESTTRLARLEVVVAGGGTLGYEIVRTQDLPESFELPGGETWTPCTEPESLAQSEGMVIDRDDGTLYVAQELTGIWRMRADFSGDPELIEKTKTFGVPATFDVATEECVPSGADPGVGGRLVADVEGLSIYYRAGAGEGYLLVSSQGDNTFAAYERSNGNRFLGAFGLGDENGIDGVEDCDGLDVTNAPAGRFGKGLIVAQDGKNEPEVLDAMGMPRDNTNFKLIPWESVATKLDLAVDTTGWTPR